MDHRSLCCKYNFLPVLLEFNITVENGSLGWEVCATGSVTSWQFNLLTYLGTFICILPNKVINLCCKHVKYDTFLDQITFQKPQFGAIWRRAFFVLKRDTMGQSCFPGPGLIYCSFWALPPSLLLLEIFFFSYALISVFVYFTSEFSTYWSKDLYYRTCNNGKAVISRSVLFSFYPHYVLCLG